MQHGNGNDENDFRYLLKEKERNSNRFEKINVLQSYSHVLIAYEATSRMQE